MKYVLAYKMVGIFDNNCNCLVFFTQVSLNIKWKKIAEEIESLRELAAFEKKQLTVEAGEGGSDKEVKVKKYEKKKRKKILLHQQKKFGKITPNSIH